MLLHLLQIFTWFPQPVRGGGGAWKILKVNGGYSQKFWQNKQIVVFLGEVSTQQSYRDRGHENG
jgi:hypothetical protein